MDKKSDSRFLDMALRLASDNILSGGGPFGAVVVRDGEIISRSGNRVVLEADPTAHAEILAIRHAATKLGTHNLAGCVLFTSCEPCPMCLGAIYWAGIERVVFAASRNDASVAGFNDQFIYDEIALDPSDRQIPFSSSERLRGVAVFEKWINYPDKTPY